MRFCPFCEVELAMVKGKRATWCNHCGASWVPKCPKCGFPTWMRLDGYYKHIIVQDCDFEGIVIK
jgi:primosomal protein N'